MELPGYWKYETGGALRPAVEAYLRGEALTGEQLAALRAYFRQWIFSPVWLPGPALDRLRLAIDGLTSRAAIDAWVETAVREGIDPL